MANWNAGSIGRPKTTSNGDIFGSEVYYNPFKLEVKTTLDRFNIFTQKKI